ncbi:hypothetical protein J132_08317 [Termitomyces sp. J132]|nr:hypothetical protein H2248_005608 [Termitomyces sp. 'cryptogamus']KNZ74058.1 hypothetical protein J132_08317 [Termitomyces sp. J132]
MSSTRKTPSATLSGASRAKTLEQSWPLLTHSDFKSLMAIETGPVRNLQDTCKWLESKGWILAADPYDQARMTSILVTAALTSKQQELKTTAIAVAFRLDANVTDHILDSLAEAVVSKTVDRLDGILGKLNTSVDFLATNDTSRTEATLSLNVTAARMREQTTLLDAVVSKIASAPLPIPSSVAQAQPRMWASVAHDNSYLSPQLLHPSPPAAPQASVFMSSPGSLSQRDHERVQQRVLQNMRTVLVSIDHENDNVPKDFTPQGTARLREHLNKVLAKLDAKSPSQENTEEGEVPAPRPMTRIIGMKLTNNSVYLLEFITADSA